MYGYEFNENELNEYEIHGYGRYGYDGHGKHEFMPELRNANERSHGFRN